MTVAELLEGIIAAYPGATPEALKTFKPVFYARLLKHEGDALAEAATAVLGSFRPTPRAPFPIPLDFEQHLPSARLELGRSGPQMDFAARRRRIEALLDDWREREGKPLSKGVSEVLAALEVVARSVAGLRAWREYPEPVVLSDDQVRLAQQRALSQERLRLHRVGGNWAQIERIAVEWGILALAEEWAARTCNGPNSPT